LPVIFQEVLDMLVSAWRNKYPSITFLVKLNAFFPLEKVAPLVTAPHPREAKLVNSKVKKLGHEIDLSTGIAFKNVPILQALR
jgi:hypothetical protein